jgi:PAS domain S-box-containing protein
MTTAPGFPDPAPHRWPIVGGATRRGGPAHPCTYFDPLFEGLPVAVAVVDTSDRVLRVNPAFCRMFGYAPEELAGRTLADLIVPDWLRHEAAVQARNAVHGAAAEVETVRRRADGSLLDVAMRRIAVEADGEVIAPSTRRWRRSRSASRTDHLPAHHLCSPTGSG